MKISPLFLLSLLLLAGCGKAPAPAPAPKPATTAAPAAPAVAEKPRLHGVIQDVLADRSSLVIRHDEIPGVMRGMTMAFRVDAATLQAAQKGQVIDGDFEAAGMNFSLSNVKLGPAPATPAAATTTAAPAAGMSMPMNTPMGQGMGMGMNMNMPMSAAAPAASPAAPATVTPELLAAGTGVYNRVCIACHQPTGAGIPTVYPPLAGSPIVTGDARRLARILLHGLQGPVPVNGVTYNNLMPGLAAQFNDAELAAVLSYVRNSWGNSAPAVPASVLATERAASRNAPWTWAELGGP
jgi:mono/diheme cytochrome c family protein/Cu/Ag efflux protein CusF